MKRQDRIGKSRMLIALFFYFLWIGTGAVIGEEPASTAIKFNHKSHVRQNEIPCEFCHVSARRSTISSIPTMQNCIGCHRTIPGSTQEQQREIEILLDLWEQGKVAVWEKKHDLPDFVHFSHKRHIQAGFDCTECHGNIADAEQINRQEAKSKLTMGWCLDCHNSHPAVNGKVIRFERVTRGGKFTGKLPKKTGEVIQGSKECQICHK